MSNKKYLLGIDLGSSSVKVSLVESESGNVAASCFKPESEMRIDSPQPDWAEQDPDTWWQHTVSAIREILNELPGAGSGIGAIGIAYQMHGLVLLDKNGEAVRPSIIWCDSRAVETGRAMESRIGTEFCYSRLLNSPGNFTASKLMWVKENEPEKFEKIETAMLPGDYIAYRLTGERQTTSSGLSEGILYDYQSEAISDEVLSGIGKNPFAALVPSFGDQGGVNEKAAAETGIAAGTPVTYRAGDQPNNAISLKVFRPGQVASTAGTSGVIYAVSGELITDKSARVNTFLHPSPAGDQLTGILLCINGTGIANRWIKELSGAASYQKMNEMARDAKAGSDGLFFYPFGNGAERMLKNQQVHASFSGISFTRHQSAEMYRAVQEGIVFSFIYGFELLRDLGVSPEKIRASRANMFLSPLFSTLFTSLTGCYVEIFDTDGARGAALAAGMGIGMYKNIENIPLDLANSYHPDQAIINEYESIYNSWKENLNKQLNS